MSLQVTTLTIMGYFANLKTKCPNEADASNGEILVRWFKERTMHPFTIYCFIMNAFSVEKFA